MLRTMVFLLLFPSISHSQLIIEWEKNYGGSQHDEFGAIIQLKDGGYIFTAQTYSSDFDVPENKGEIDIWICKIDAKGKIEWSRTFGGSKHDRPNYIAEMPDGNILIFGSTESNDMDVPENKGSRDIWLLSLDFSGNLRWSKTIGGSDEDDPSFIFPASDGGYVLTGSTRSNDGDFSANMGESDAFLLKISKDGAIEWSRTYGGSLSDGFGGFIPTKNNSFLISGVSYSSDGDVPTNKGDLDIWLSEINQSGEIIWSKTFGGIKSDYGGNLTKIGNQYIIAATSDSDYGDVGITKGKDYWVFSVDEWGNLLWSNTFGGSESEVCFKVFPFSEEEYLTCGWTNSDEYLLSPGNSDLWLVKGNRQGDIIWQQAYGGRCIEFFPYFIQTTDGGFMSISSSCSSDGDVSGNYDGGFDHFDIWLTKFAPDGVQIEETCNPLNLYPNPFSGEQLYLDFQNPSGKPASIQIFDAAGRSVLVHEMEEIGFDRRIKLQLPQLSTGIYFVKVFDCSDKPSYFKVVKIE